MKLGRVNRRLISTAQILKQRQIFKFNKRRVTIQQSVGVCGHNYYIDFGAAVLAKAIAMLPHHGRNVQSVAEFGVGKGVYLCLLSTLPSVQKLWGNDISYEAVILTRLNLQLNGAKNFQVVQESVQSALQRRWRSDFIAFDLPLIPLWSTRDIPADLKSILGGAGPGGRRFFDLVIENVHRHLHRGGGVFFVQPSFIQGGFRRTAALMHRHGLTPILLREKKKYLHETILTRRLRPLIEDSTRQKFSRDKRGYFFTMQAVLGIRK